MAALWIAHVNVTDEERYGRYVAKAGDILASHGATFLARGGRAEQMEGAEHARHVVARFPSVEAARACYQSDAYQAAAGDAIDGSDRSIVIVEITD